MTPLNNPFAFAVLIAVTAVVYSLVLTRPGEIFSGLFLRLDTWFKNDNRMIEGKGQHPVFKALIGCHKCVAGQWAFWIFGLFHVKIYFQFHPYLCLRLFVLQLLFCGLTIFLSICIKKIYSTYIES